VDGRGRRAAGGASRDEGAGAAGRLTARRSGFATFQEQDIPGAIDDFIARWTAAEQAERTNAPPFLIELCGLLGIEPPPPARGGTGSYRFERSVTHRHEDARETTRRIDLYKHDCFILEAKQGANVIAPELFALQGEATRRQAVRNSPG